MNDISTKTKKAQELAGYFQLFRERLRVAEKSNPATCEILNMQEAHTLLSMGNRGAMTMSEIAKVLYLSLSSATSIVDKLENKNFVRRDRSSEDRRIVRVELTKEGTRFYELVKDGQLRLADDALSTLNSREQDLLLELFRKITTKFRADMAEQ